MFVCSISLHFRVICKHLRDSLTKFPAILNNFLATCYAHMSNFLVIQGLIYVTNSVIIPLRVHIVYLCALEITLAKSVCIGNKILNPDSIYKQLT